MPGSTPSAEAAEETLNDSREPEDIYKAEETLRTVAFSMSS